MRGFTLTEILVGIFLILLVFLGIFGAFRLTLKVIGQSRARILALFLANQELEKIRALSYENIGIIGGFPEGILEKEETLQRNNINFKIVRRVDFVVDDQDGLLPPEDECPNDYKKVEVLVSWPGILGGEVKMTTFISPQNLVQECEVEGGILLVNVFDAYGNMVSLPLIEILDPQTDSLIKDATPLSGKHYFSLPEGTFKVKVSKPDYSSQRTYGLEEVALPEKPHPIVLKNQLTEISFSIDKLSSMKIQTLASTSQGYLPLANVTFHLQGAKIIGKDENEEPIYKFSKDFTTDENGEIFIQDLEWDSYSFSLPQNSLDLLETQPPQPVSLPPGTSTQVFLYLKAENALFVTIQNQQTKEPVFSAKVKLENLEQGYEKIEYTDEEGKAYFLPLESALYNVFVEAQGYLSTSTEIEVIGDTTKTIFIEQIE